MATSEIVRQLCNLRWKGKCHRIWLKIKVDFEKYGQKSRLILEKPDAALSHNLFQIE